MLGNYYKIPGFGDMLCGDEPSSSFDPNPEALISEVY